MNKIKLRLFFIFSLFLVSCSRHLDIQVFPTLSTSTDIPINVPITIECTTAYRSNVFIQIEARKSVKLSSANDDAEVLFKDLTFHARYFDGLSDALRGLKLWVTTENSKNEISSVLYQFSRSKKLENQVLEHGFTGLNYVYNPVSRSELQYWCKTE
jgi:hypothetical protein